MFFFHDYWNKPYFSHILQTSTLQSKVTGDYSHNEHVNITKLNKALWRAQVKQNIELIENVQKIKKRVYQYMEKTNT